MKKEHDHITQYKYHKIADTHHIMSKTSYTSTKYIRKCIIKKKDCRKELHQLQPFPFRKTFTFFN